MKNHKMNFSIIFNFACATKIIKLGIWEFWMASVAISFIMNLTASPTSSAFNDALLFFQPVCNKAKEGEGERQTTLVRQG